MVDFIIDRMLTELRNESEIDNGGILLFLPIGKPDTSPSQQNKLLNSLSLNFSQKQRGAKKETNIHHEYLPEDFGEFKLVRYPTGMREDYQVLSVIEHLTLIIIRRRRTIILIIKRIRYQLQSIHHLKPL